MTFVSLLHAIFALLWCLLFFVSVAGWGGVALRLFRAKTHGFVEGWVAGLAIVAVIGGILNLFRMIYPGVLVGLVLVGAALCIAVRRPALSQHPRTSTRRDGIAFALLILFCLLLAFRLLSTVHRTEYQGVDDYEAYLLFPKKMLQLHYFAPDPFNERRLQSSIGLPYFLQDMFLAILPLESTQMLDQGAGVLLLAVAAFAVGRRRELSRDQQWLLALVAIALPQIRFNLTMTTLPAALFVAAAAIAADEELALGWTRPALLGAAAALIIACKSTYLPAIFLFCVFLFLLESVRGGWKRCARNLAIASAVCVIVLLPWAIAMRQTSGTYFFPVFGKGFDYTRYYHLPPISTFHTRTALLKIFAFVLPLFPFLVAELWLMRAQQDTAATLAMTAAAILGSVLTGYATGGDSIKRYTWPCILPALLLIFAWSLRRWARSERNRTWALPAPAVALLLFWSGYMLHWEDSYREMALDAWASLRPWEIEPAPVRARLAQLEAALPQNGVVLETLDFPMLLDFRGRRIESADFPAAASPPPGWPIYSTGEALATYLGAHGIRYLAYAYADQGFLNDDASLAAQTNPQVTQAWRNILFLMVKAHEQYRELAASRRRIYDDGCVWVVDLTQHQINPPPIPRSDCFLEDQEPDHRLHLPWEPRP